MGPILQWHRATVSTVLRDCDHRLVEPLPEDAGKTASMPDAMFKAHMNTDVSWGESSLSILMNSIGAWPSPSPPKFQIMGIMHRAILYSRGDSDRMSEMWTSLLLVVGSVCVRRASVNTFDMAHWVISVTEWGALVVRMFRHVFGDCVVWSLSREAAQAREHTLMQVHKDVGYLGIRVARVPLGSSNNYRNQR